MVILVYKEEDWIKGCKQTNWQTIINILLTIQNLLCNNANGTWLFTLGEILLVHPKSKEVISKMKKRRLSVIALKGAIEKRTIAPKLFRILGEPIIFSFTRYCKVDIYSQITVYESSIIFLSKHLDLSGN